MSIFVAYYRVSTDRQGESGLGMEAQRSAVARYIEAQGGTMVAEFEEVESGRRHKNRPALAAALEACRQHGAMLVIAKLDRLARNVHFISGLIESRVQFVCCDNPHVHSRDHHGRFMLHQLAVMAEWEAGAISQRTKDAMQEARRQLAEKGHRVSTRGKVYTSLGNPRWEESLGHARAARNFKPIPAEVVQQITRHRAEGWTLQQIATHLENMKVPTPRGRRWHPKTISTTIERATK